MTYVRNPQTIVDPSPGGDSVKEAVDEKNNQAIDDLFTNLNSHSNNEDGRSHVQIDALLDSITDPVTGIVPEAEAARDAAQLSASEASASAAEAEAQATVSTEQASISTSKAAESAASAVDAEASAVEAAASAAKLPIVTAADEDKVPVVNSSGGYDAEYLPTPQVQDAVVGGNFDYWPEGIEFINPVSGTFAAAMFAILYDGSGGDFTVSQGGGPLSVGATNALRWNQTTPQSGGTFNIFEHRIEDGTTFNSDSATISFGIDANGVYNCSVQIVQNFGTGGSPSAEVVVGTIPFTTVNGSSKFEHTFSVPSTASKTFGNNFNDHVKIRIALPVSESFDISVWQLKYERGKLASPFQYKPLSERNNDIERFLQFSQISMGGTAQNAGEYLYQPVPYKTRMRAVPTIIPLGDGTSVNLSVVPSLTDVKSFAATSFVASASGGAFYVIGETAKLDARL